LLETEQRPFVRLVDKILAAKKADPDADTRALEDRIDLMVYKLYGLTPEECAVVDPDFDAVLAGFGLSRADYDRLSIEEIAGE
jgi:hypothetical protein